LHEAGPDGAVRRLPAASTRGRRASRRRPPARTLAGVDARVQALEREAATARAEANRLASQPLTEGRKLQDAADRLRDETEAISRAEARADAAGTESHA
jgi:hypothetical protein